MCYIRSVSDFLSLSHYFSHTHGLLTLQLALITPKRKIKELGALSKLLYKTHSLWSVNHQSIKSKGRKSESYHLISKTSCPLHLLLLLRTTTSTTITSLLPQGNNSVMSNATFVTLFSRYYATTFSLYYNTFYTIIFLASSLCLVTSSPSSLLGVIYDHVLEIIHTFALFSFNLYFIYVFIYVVLLEPFT